ncbi:MAG: diguanylate cyclase [Terracidiphilus sp.]|nr:diguanylate cyclase [Terracidiphilus sp.]
MAEAASISGPLLRFAARCIVAGELLLSCASAQRYSFTEPASGLDNLNVDCVAQDSIGYLWVGTENGLYQYDGNRFSKFGPAQGLNARTIQDILPGPGGTLLVGSTEGIFFRDSNGQFSEVPSPDLDNRFSLRIGSVFTHYGSGHFVITSRSGVYELSRDDASRWTSRNMHLSSEQVWSVFTDPAGALWFGCGDDLCKLQNGKVDHLRAILHLPAERWLHMQLDRQQHLWIRGGAHIGEIDPVHARYTEHPLPGHANATPYDALSIDAQGHIMASQGPAFGIWIDDHWRMITQRNGLSRFDISALIADREGSIWIGVVGHGVIRWVGQDRWESFSAAEGLSDDIVWSTLRDRAGRLWIGTESGLDWIPPGSTQIQHWVNPAGSTPRAVALVLDPGGDIWLGTANGTLLRIDQHSLASRLWRVPEVYRLLMGPDRRLWIATNAGLWVMDCASANAAPQLVTDPAIHNPKARFRNLSFDQWGQLWASSDEALYRHNALGWTRIDSGLAGIIPFQIAADHAGNLWASGPFTGLMRLRISGNKVVECEHILRPHLLSDQVVSLSVDSRGWLWLGQDAGVTVFDGHTWRSFTQNDGLIWNDTDTYALYEDHDGSMWIGTSGGISHLIRPDAVTALQSTQPAIEQIAYGTKPVFSNLKMRWMPTPLTISLATLRFGSAHHFHLRYRLLGLEPDWIDTTEGAIRYPRLEPGHYTFQAVTTDLSGSRVSPVSEVNFVILPRWWQTWAFRLILVVLAATLITWLWHWRVQLLVRQRSVLELAVLERTQELEQEKTELLHAREQMRHFAESDGLTSLLNHRVILDRLRGEVERSLREGTPLSIIMIDLDHFKSINDAYGHMAGDQVLKVVAAILQRSIRSYDWVGRYGGEEFLLILPGSSFDAAKTRAGQMRIAIKSATIVDGDRTIHVTASFGVAAGFPATLDAAIRTADQALYRAKSSGRDCVIVSEIPAPGTLIATDSPSAE